MYPQKRASGTYFWGVFKEKLYWGRLELLTRCALGVESRTFWIVGRPKDLAMNVCCFLTYCPTEPLITGKGDEWWTQARPLGLRKNQPRWFSTFFNYPSPNHRLTRLPACKIQSRDRTSSSDQYYQYFSMPKCVKSDTWQQIADKEQNISSILDDDTCIQDTFLL